MSARAATRKDTLNPCSSSSRPDRALRPPASSRPGWRCPASPTVCTGCPRSPGSIWCRTAPRATPTRSATPPWLSRCWWPRAWCSLLSLFPHPSDAYRKVGAGAGHSVGEITAAVGGGVITAEQAMVFVRERGNAMAAAAAVTATGMTAVLGGDRDEVVTKAAQHGLTAANENGAGQIVAAGTLEQLAALRRGSAGEARGCARCRSPAPSTPSTWRRRSASSRRYARSISTHDPRTAADLQRRRPGRLHSGKEVLTRLVDPGEHPGALGPVHGRPWRELGVTARDRAAAGRHAHRPGQARPPRRRDAGAQDPRRPRRRLGPRRAARHGEPAVRSRRRGACSSPRPRASSGSACSPAPATALVAGRRSAPS